MNRLLALAMGLALLALVPAASARRVRVFAVGPRFDLSWVDTRQRYHDKLFALVDKRLRGDPGTPLIQRGADDVASHLRGPSDPRRPVQTAQDLVALPEDVGLMAAFVGARGAPARSVTADTGGSTAAFASLIGTYAPVVAYYATRYPALASRVAPARLAELALTDTLARTAVETFAELAARYRVYLAAGITMARDWQIVCADKASFKPPPGGMGCAQQDPVKVSELRMPDEPERDYAYEATTDETSGMALVFDPTGRLISKEVKTYLTPEELPGLALDLVPGSVSDGLSAVSTPVGTLGFVISKDAWMPDVTDRLDQEHVDLLVQPEWFTGDTVRTHDDSGQPVMWAPDNIKAAGYSDVLRDPSIGAFVLPSLTGNFFDLPADNQQAIAVKPRSLTARWGFLVGQPPGPGYAQVQSWLAADPVSLPFRQRRAQLGEAGDKELPKDSNPPCPAPDEPGPCRGGQVEGVIHYDVQIGSTPALHRQRRRKRGATPFSLARPIAPSRYAQRNVALAASGRDAWAVFEERRGGRDQVFIVRTRDAGRNWTAPVRPAVGRADSVNEWWPSVAAGPSGQVWVAWQDDSSGRWRAYFALSRDGGRRFSEPRPVTADAPAEQWRPAIAATATGRAVVVFLDERERSSDDDLPQRHVYVVRVQGLAASAPLRLDDQQPTTLAEKLDNAWAPSVSASGQRILAAWVDFHTYDWRTWARTSSDGAATFAPVQPVTDAPSTDETLGDTPRAAWTATGPLVAFTDYRKRTSSAFAPHELYDIYAAPPGGENRQVDQHGGDQVDSFSPGIVALPRGGALVAWQDHPQGPADVFIRRISGSGAPAGQVIRVDDSGPQPWNQWRPALALTGSSVLGAWEDDRDGPSQVFAASAPLTRIR